MDVRSEPKFETFQVTDIDVAYPGETVTLTLEDGKDKYDIVNGDLMVARASGETLRFRTEPMHWMSIRPRTMRRKVEESK